jgi:Kef-type K+ transport system membrane component KefB
VTPTGRRSAALAYIAMIGAAVLAFAWIRSAGSAVSAPAHAMPGASPVTGIASTSAPASADTLFHLLLALAVIIVTARIMGRIFQSIMQPPVVGEVIGGIMLGPSLLGRFAPELSAGMLPGSIAPFLGLHAQLGIMLYMFIVGLELDAREIRRSGHTTVAISHASIVVPFLLGSALALFLYPRFSYRDVSFTVFSLFIGVSMAITAFPVLARILSDSGMSRTRLGTIALTCAAVDDVTAWCLLALVAGIARARAADAIRTVALTALFVMFMVAVVAPMIRRLLPALERSTPLPRPALAAILVAVIVSAMTTEYIGIHGIFGAFLLGALVPSGARLVGELRNRLEDVVAVLFLPAFFAYTGLRTEVGLIGGWSDWLWCAAIVAVACAGKFGGTAAAARVTGLGWRDAAALGVLMNTRGLVGLVVLDIGLDLGVISPRLFTMLVIMAVATTMMTMPALHLIAPDAVSLRARESAGSGREAADAGVRRG